MELYRARVYKRVVFLGYKVTPMSSKVMVCLKLHHSKHVNFNGMEVNGNLSTKEELSFPKKEKTGCTAILADAANGHSSTTLPMMNKSERDHTVRKEMGEKTRYTNQQRKSKIVTQ